MRPVRQLRAERLWAGVAAVALCWGAGDAWAAKAAQKNPPAVRITGVSEERATIERFDRYELTVQIEGTIENPYNPDEVALDATFSPPQGRPITVPGFYYEPFERVREGTSDQIRPSGAPVWKIRFTPREAGRWSQTVRLTSRGETQTWPARPFLVSRSSNAGFLEIDRESGYLRFETGTPFLPIGENVCWGPSGQPLAAYDRWFQALAKQRANFVRMWLAPWSFRLETKETKVGRYDQRRAWQIDYLLAQSRQYGLYVQLCLLNHGQFSRSQDADWQNNPYNEALGGMCRLPSEFVTLSTAKTLFRRLLRYVVARWGYSPNLATWELLNEADFTEFSLEDLPAWVGEMSGYLRANDVNHPARPITISFHHESPKAVWGLPTIDTIQWHAYDQRDFARLFAGDTMRKLRKTYRKPVLIGEFGWIQEFVRRLDTGGIHLHDGLWSSLLGGSMGSAMPWYWDTYLHPNRLERHYRPLSIFWRGEPLGAGMEPMAVAVSREELLGLGMGTPDRVYLWVKNQTHNMDQYLAYRCELTKQRIRSARGQPVRRVSYPPMIVRGATVTLRGLDWKGRYQIEWWDPYGGRIVSRAVAQAQWGGALTLEVPEVAYDLAAKVIRIGFWERGAAG